MRSIRVIMAAIFLSLPTTALAETFLLMAEEVGCIWCARWHREIGGIYPKSVEGKAAPLRTYDLHGDQPNIQFASRVRFTPTFVLVQNGVEVGRIEGYPGQEFFWGLLAQLLNRANASTQGSGRHR